MSRKPLGSRVVGAVLAMALLVMGGTAPGFAETLRVVSGEVGATGFKMKPTARMGVPVRGAINIQPGQVEFDPETGAMSGYLVLDITSFNTGNPARDANIRQGAFLVNQFASWTLSPLSLTGYDPASSDPMQTADLAVRIAAMGLSEDRTIKVRVATSDDRVMIASAATHYMHAGDSPLAQLIVSGIERVCLAFHQAPFPNIQMTLDGNPVSGFATADFAIVDLSVTLARQ